jgi:DNA modification methylase
MKNDLHPTMKPIALVERAINNSSRTMDIVLDPFGGSGSTLIACEKTNRRCRMIELDEKYIDTIIRRWEEFTGEMVIHENGKTFAQIQNERA